MRERAAAALGDVPRRWRPLLPVHPGNLRFVKLFPGGTSSRAAYLQELPERICTDLVCAALAGRGRFVLYTPETVVVAPAPPLFRPLPEARSSPWGAHVARRSGSGASTASARAPADRARCIPSRRLGARLAGRRLAAGLGTPGPPTSRSCSSMRSWQSCAFARCASPGWRQSARRRPPDLCRRSRRGACEARLKVSVVIPLYNEQDSIGQTIGAVDTALREAGLEAEIVVVDPIGRREQATPCGSAAGELPLESSSSRTAGGMPRARLGSTPRRVTTSSSSTAAFASSPGR